MKKILSLVLVLSLLLCASALAGEKITVMATATPHDIILQFVKDDLKALGYDLDVIVVDDYYIGNPSTAAGEVDCNYFQHIPFLDAYNASAPEDEQLVAALGIHCEPYGIYPGTKSSLDAIAAGDKIAITNDPSNETRALLLLEAAGLIVLPEGSNYDSNLRKEDIVDAKGLNIVELDAQMIPTMLDDVAFAIINGNYVLDAGMSVSDALFLETEGVTGAIYTNYIVCRPEDVDSDWMNALKTVLFTEKVYNFIVNANFEGGVIPSFEY